MIKKITFLLIGTLISININSQDLVDGGDVQSLEHFQSDLISKIPFGTTITRLHTENKESFVKRILGGSITTHHGVFELAEFNNCIISFGSYNFNEQPIIIGIVLEPINKNGEYRILKTMELASGCGNDPEIKTVFLHDVDKYSLGRELIIHASDYCDRHGTYNYVFIYNEIIEDNKLRLFDFLTERCDYSEAKINGEWDFDIGESNVEERRYFECNYSDYEQIRTHLTNN